MAMIYLYVNLRGVNMTIGITIGKKAKKKIEINKQPFTYGVNADVFNTSSNGFGLGLSL